jgi:hypothetical protein
VLKKIITFIIAAYLPVIAILFIGCEEEDSYRPAISGVVPSLHGDPKPMRETYKIEDNKKYKTTTSGYSAWAPPSSYEKNWKAIIIHHSATDTGSVASIDDYHRKNNGWDGIGYNFVIGNGKGTGNGQVESTYRWKGQKTGAHCKTDSTNWANENAIGICLVGNFDYSRPSTGQVESLVKLVRFLSERYDIPQSRIYGHNTTPGRSTNTNCPGKNFPMWYVKSKL